MRPLVCAIVSRAKGGITPAIRAQLAPFKAGTRVELTNTVFHRGAFAVVAHPVLTRRVVCVQLPNGNLYDAWPENLTVQP